MLIAPISTRNLCLFGVTHHPKCFRMMAGTTGLEPATSAVTGQRSNQLNYVPTLAGSLGDPLQNKSEQLSLLRRLIVTEDFEA